MNNEDLSPPRLLDALTDVAANLDATREEAKNMLLTIAAEEGKLASQREMILRIFPELDESRPKRRRKTAKKKTTV